MIRSTMVMASVLAMVNAAWAAESTFDSNDEGWRITGDAQGGSALPTYYATGGNGGGYVGATDDVLGGVWYFKAPETFHGNFAGGYSTALSFDLRQSGLNNQFDAVDIYLRGGGLELTYDTSYNPGTTWTAYSIPLTELSGWKLAGVPPTRAQMLQVLADITDLQIRGEFITGPDVDGLDNVVLVPEPATIALLALGGLAMIRRRRT